MNSTEGARKLPTQHITIRVPWHDNGWNGTVCKNPCANTACLNLTRTAENKDDSAEEKVAGQSIKLLDIRKYPACVNEHGTIMADFEIQSTKNHPYKKSNDKTHGHFADTHFTFQRYAAAAVPFRWMLRAEVEGDSRTGVESIAERLKLGWEPEREPELSFDTAWVQEGKNQLVMLNTFFSAVEPESSLVFFYSKKTPLSEDPHRVIVGVGRVTSVGIPTEISGYWKNNRVIIAILMACFL